MAYSTAVLQRAKARLQQAKQEQERDADMRIASIYHRLPRLEEIDAELRKTVAKIMAVTFRQGADPTVAMAGLKKDNLALQQEREWILEAENLEESDLRADAICPTCKGSGYMGAVMCECLGELCRQEQKKELSSLLGSGKETFDHFRLSWYPTEMDARLGTSPRTLMESVFARSRRYAKEFSKKSPSLLFSGGTGLGKTFLSAAIARSVADGGFSVVYETAVRIFADYEGEKFSNADHQTNKYTNCDLLIVDDLGTEMTTQFTLSVLYTLVNGRILAGRPTIISTNLTTDEIRRRYTPQTASRLLGVYDLFLFAGKDIRLLSK